MATTVQRLLSASAKGQHDVVAALLREPEGRAALNNADEVGETALYKAVTFNHPDIGTGPTTIGTGMVVG